MIERQIQAAATFEDFYRLEYRPVVAVGLALTGNLGVAEDIAQEAFLATHARWERIAAYDNPGAFVRRVATNRAVDRRRRSLTEVRALERLSSRRPPPAAPMSAEAEHFWEAVRRLPARQAQAVALFYLEDRPTAEIAAILECTEATVRGHLHSGRKALAAALRVELEDE